MTARWPKLVPAAEREPAHLTELRGWLDGNDPFFTDIDAIVAARSCRLPRALTTPGKREPKQS